MTTTTIAGTEIDAAIVTLERVANDLVTTYMRHLVTGERTEESKTVRQCHFTSARWLKHALDCLREASRHQQDVPFIQELEKAPSFHRDITRPACTDCHGTGVYDEDECAVCGGSGNAPEPL